MSFSNVKVGSENFVQVHKFSWQGSGGQHHKRSSKQSSVICHQHQCSCQNPCIAVSMPVSRRSPEFLSNLSVQMYRNSYHTIPGISTGISFSKMLKFYINSLSYSTASVPNAGSNRVYFVFFIGVFIRYNSRLLRKVKYC